MQKKPTVRVEIDAVNALFIIWMLVGQKNVFLRSELTRAVLERAKQVGLTEDEFITQTTGYMSLPSLMGGLGGSMMRRGYLDREDVGKYRILPAILEKLKMMTNTNSLVADVVTPPADEALDEEENDEGSELVDSFAGALLLLGCTGMARWVRVHYPSGSFWRLWVEPELPATPELITKMVEHGFLKRVLPPNGSQSVYQVEFGVTVDGLTSDSIDRWALEQLKMNHPAPPEEAPGEIEQPSFADIDEAITRLEELDEGIDREIEQLFEVEVIDAKIHELAVEIRRLQAEREKVIDLGARSEALASVIRVVKRVRHDDEQRMMRQNAEDNSLLLIENEMENQAKLLGKTPAEMLALLQARFVAAGK